MDQYFICVLMVDVIVIIMTICVIMKSMCQVSGHVATYVAAVTLGFSVPRRVCGTSLFRLQLAREAG